MKKMLERFRAWLRFEGIVRYHKRAGSLMPTLSALDEIRMRGLLEEFRDYATERYITDAMEIGDIKDAWFRDRLRPMSKAIGQKKARAIRDAIKAMPPDEVLHPDALRLWWQDSRRMASDGGFLDLFSEHEKRVLLG